MVAPIDISGQRYGRLVALHRAPNRGRRTVWAFACDCGSAKEIGLEAVRSGQAISCGCVRAEKTRARSLKHGHAVNRRSSPELKARDHAKSRCNNPNDPKYPQYGGRGIRMHQTWQEDFAAFLRDMGPRPKGTSLDRIDVNGHYEPGNCRWATPAEQARNRTDNVVVETALGPMILRDFADHRGVPYKALSRRMRQLNQSAEEAAAALAR